MASPHPAHRVRGKGVLRALIERAQHAARTAAKDVGAELGVGRERMPQRVEGRKSLRWRTWTAPSTAQTENTCFARSTPMVIVPMGDLPFV